MATYVTAQELELAMGSSTYVAVFADHGTDLANADAVSLILRAAHADVRRHALRGYDGEPEFPVPDELWALELDFAKARAYMRGDAYTRDTGKELMEMATATAKAIGEGLIRGGPKMPNPTCAVAPATPAPGASAAGPIDFERTSVGTGTLPERFFVVETER